MACPICEKDTDPKYRPFCSRRCADVDLGRWLNGSYAVPSNSTDDLDEAAEAMSQALSQETSKPH